MSVNIVYLIWRNHALDLSPTEISTLTCLASYGDADGKSIYPSVKRVSCDTRLSRATVMRSIKKLVEKGFLVKESASTRGYFFTNLYNIDINLIKKPEQNIEDCNQFIDENEDFSVDCITSGGITVTPPRITEMLGGITVTPSNQILPVSQRYQVVSQRYYPVSQPVSQRYAPRITVTPNLSFTYINKRKEKNIKKKKDEKSDESFLEKKTKGCRLDPEVVLTDEWVKILVKAGIHESHKKTVFTLFVNYWVSKPGKDGVKLDWKKTWQNWCINGLRFDRKLKYSEQAQSAGGTSEDLVMMGIDRHAAYKKFEKTGNPEDAPKELTIDDMLEKCARMAR